MIFDQKYSSLYDLLYREKNYHRECLYLNSLFKKFSRKPDSLIELGCGTGGHAIHLADMGYMLTCIDRSAYMLSAARRKAGKAGQNIHFIQGDITEIELKGKWDGVISMFSVVGYQITNKLLEKTFLTARELLKDKGLFLFDCWYGPAVLSNKPERRCKEIIINERERIIRFSEPQLDISNHLVHVKYKVWHIVDNSIAWEIEEVHTMRFFFQPELTYFLEKTGFKNFHVFPFLKLHKNLNENDWNIMIVAS